MLTAAAAAATTAADLFVTLVPSHFYPFHCPDNIPARTRVHPNNPMTPLWHGGIMTTHHDTTPTGGSLDVIVPEAPLQLSLQLATSDRPLQFRIPRHTRELGLARIAQIRREMAERAAQRALTEGSTHAA